MWKIVNNILLKNPNGKNFQIILNNNKNWTKNFLVEFSNKKGKNTS